MVTVFDVRFVDNMKTPQRQRDNWNRYRAKDPEKHRERCREQSKTRVRDHAEDYRKAAVRLRTKETWPRFILPGIKHRAKKKGLSFDLEPADIIVPDVCPVLGIPINVRTGNHPRRNFDSPSVDRIRNDIGYVKGNIRVISSRANSLKSDATITELEAVLAYMKREHAVN